MSGATYQPLTISPQTSVSFRCDDPEQLTALLESHGYLAGKAHQREHARLHGPSGAIAVIFDSGSVLVQGKSTAPLLHLLNSLCPDTMLDLFGSVA